AGGFGARPQVCAERRDDGFFSNRVGRKARRRDRRCAIEAAADVDAIVRGHIQRAATAVETKRHESRVEAAINWLPTAAFVSRTQHAHTTAWPSVDYAVMVVEH